MSRMTRKELLIKLRGLMWGLNEISDNRSVIDWMFGSVELGASLHLQAIRDSIRGMEDSIKLTFDLEHIKDGVDDEGVCICQDDPDPSFLCEDYDEG